MRGNSKFFKKKKMKREEPISEKNDKVPENIEDKKRKIDIFNIDDGSEEFLLENNFLCSSVKEKRCISFSKFKNNNIDSIFSVYSFFSLIFSFEILNFLIKEINENF